MKQKSFKILLSWGLSTSGPTPGLFSRVTCFRSRIKCQLFRDLSLPPNLKYIVPNPFSSEHLFLFCPPNITVGDYISVSLLGSHTVCLSTCYSKFREDKNHACRGTIKKLLHELASQIYVSYINIQASKSIFLSI